MEIQYVIINFIILAVILFLFGRKMVKSIFKTRFERINRELDEAEEADAKELILRLLSDGKPHPTSELYRLPCDTAAIDAALRQLVSEERLQQQDGMLKKAAE